MLRDGAEQTFDVGTAAMRGEDIDRLLLWAGAVLHAPHRAMSIQRAIPPEGVFVAYFAYGSPATRYKLFAGRRIVAVDGRPTPDLDAFIAAVKGRENRSSVRLKTVTWNGTVDVTTLKARPGLLADVRTATHARWLGAQGHSIAPPRRAWGIVCSYHARMVTARLPQDEIDQAVEALRAGEVVAFPTETVYGLGADAQNPDAVRKIFELKGRPATHPADHAHRTSARARALGPAGAAVRRRHSPSGSGRAR